MRGSRRRTQSGIGARRQASHKKKVGSLPISHTLLINTKVFCDFRRSCPRCGRQGGLPPPGEEGGQDKKSVVDDPEVDKDVYRDVNEDEDKKDDDSSCMGSAKQDGKKVCLLPKCRSFLALY